MAACRCAPSARRSQPPPFALDRSPPGSIPQAIDPSCSPNPDKRFVPPATPIDVVRASFQNANRYISCFHSRALLVLVIDIIRASTRCFLRLACAMLYFPRASFVCLFVPLSDGPRVRFLLLPRLCVCFCYRSVAHWTSSSARRVSCVGVRSPSW